jgi:hypothetical protein
VTHYLFEHTQRSPIVIPVVNIISGGSGKSNQGDTKNTGQKQTVELVRTPEQIAVEQQKRFQEMRARLLTQDPRID